ncbi:MAG: translation initiation factor IF-2 [Symbiobacteriia bacterium]
MEKKRVYELAKDLGLDSKKIIDVLAKMDVEVKNHMSTVEPDVADKVTAMLTAPAKTKTKAAAKAAEPKVAEPKAAEPVAAEPKAAPKAAAGKTAAARAARVDTETSEATVGGTTATPVAASAAGAAGSPPVQRLYNKVDLRKQEKVFRTPPPRPAAGPARDPGRGRTGTASILVGGMGGGSRSPAGTNYERQGQRARRPAGEHVAAAGTAVVTAPGRAAAPAIAGADGLTATPAARPVPATEPYLAEGSAAGSVMAPETASFEVQTPEITQGFAPEAEAPAVEAYEADTEAAAPAAPRAPRPAEGSVVGTPAAMRRPVGDVPDHGDPRGPRRPGSGPTLGGPAAGPRQPMAGPRQPMAAGPRSGGLGMPGMPGQRPPSSGLGPPRPPGSGPAPSFGRPGAPRPGGPGRGGPRSGPGGRLTVPPPPKEVQAQAAAQQTSGRPRSGFGNKRGDARRRSGDRRFSEDFGRFERRSDRRTATQPPKNVKPILIEGPITVKDLAAKMAVGAGEVIKKLFLSLGVTATINAEIEVETAELVCTELGFPVEIHLEKTEAEEDVIYDADIAPESLVVRPPVVTVMGHVDHGKTSLLDGIRETRVAAGEAGGITQHIGAYQVELNGRRITFLDTPGHEAFTAMRARGAQVTDVVVLVVAADDGVMPQTVEAINHAKAAGVPILVAINKIDKANANPERVKTELMEYGLVAEQWGGETVMVPVSAKNHEGLDQLLEMILLVSDVREPKADPTMGARGTVVEAQLDKGRGPMATVLIQNGTLQPGDAFLCGATWGKVRAMMDDKGKKLKKAGPSTPVQILGYTDVPAAGDVFRVMDEKDAREQAEKRKTRRRAVEMDTTSRLTLDDLSKRISEGDMRDLNLIVKADVQGSVEALRGSLEKLHNEEVRVAVIHGGVGAITESDVMLAYASGAIIIGFNVRPDVNARHAAEENKVDLRLYRVIYDATDDISAALKGMLKPKMEEVVLGRAEVRQVFRVPKLGAVAGAFVLEGKILRNASVRVLRDNVVVFEGKIASLKRFKDDAREVVQGFECGLGIENFNDIKEGDQVEAFTIEEVKAD